MSQIAQRSTGSAVAVLRVRGGLRRRRLGLWAIPLLIPALAFALFVVIVPAVRGGLVSFTDWNGLSPDFDWTGLKNYVRLLSDPLAASAVLNTIVIIVVSTVATNLLGLGLAMLLNAKMHLKGIYRVIYFAPVIITPVIISGLWKYLYLPDGPLNEVLRGVGLGALAHPWLGDSDTALGAVIVVMVWQNTGIAMVIYLAGLQNVPTELVEAARLDGAGPFRVFRYITLPELRPAAVTTTLLFLIIGTKAFDQVWVLTTGGPGTSTQTLSTAQYQVTFLFGEYSYGATFAVVLSVLAIVIAVLQQVVTRRRRDA
jgi:raffinose/stachyose/melibiose transport system permease protein